MALPSINLTASPTVKIFSASLSEISDPNSSSKAITNSTVSKRHANDRLIAEERMKQFERDVLHWINYDYVVINNDLNDCYLKITNLIDAVINNGSKDYDPDYIRSHVDKLTS